MTHEISNAEDAKWLQGFCFYPSTNFSSPVDFDSKNEILILITQSCSIQSGNNVEVIVGKKIVSRDKNKHDSTGKSQKSLYLETDKLPGYEGILVDPERRFFFLKNLLKLQIPLLIFNPKVTKRLAFWIGRSYTRNALPDELVTRMKKGFFEKVEKILKKSFEGTTLKENIIDLYYRILIEPIDVSKPYELEFLWLCSRSESSDFFRQEFELSLQDFFAEKDGISIKQIQFLPKTETVISELDDLERFSHWDYFTEFGQPVWGLKDPIQ